MDVLEGVDPVEKMGGLFKIGAREIVDDLTGGIDYLRVSVGEETELHENWSVRMKRTSIVSDSI